MCDVRAIRDKNHSPEDSYGPGTLPLCVDPLSLAPDSDCKERGTGNGIFVKRNFKCERVRAPSHRINYLCNCFFRSTSAWLGSVCAWLRCGRKCREKRKLLILITYNLGISMRRQIHSTWLRMVAPNDNGLLHIIIIIIDRVSKHG